MVDNDARVARYGTRLFEVEGLVQRLAARVEHVESLLTLRPTLPHVVLGPGDALVITGTADMNPAQYAELRASVAAVNLLGGRVVIVPDNVRTRVERDEGCLTCGTSTEYHHPSDHENERQAAGGMSSGHMPADNTVDVDDGGAFWRVVITDTERASGVAPTCAQQMTPGSLHDVNPEPAPGDRFALPRYDTFGVYDCCPHPHIEAWGEGVASDLADSLNRHDVRLCT